MKNNHSEDFNNLLEKLQICLADNREHPCESCVIQYSDLNNFYTQLNQHSNGKVCFDLQDQVSRKQFYC